MILEVWELKEAGTRIGHMHVSRIPPGWDSIFGMHHVLNILYSYTISRPGLSMHYSIEQSIGFRDSIVILGIMHKADPCSLFKNREQGMEVHANDASPVIHDFQSLSGK